MREPSMKWFFESRGNGGRADHGAAADGDDDSAPGLTGLPATLLQRHGALVLDPGRAAAVHGWPVPGPTVYRARTLLIPADLLDNPAAVAAIDTALARVGMSLAVPPRPDRTSDDDGTDGDRARDSDRAGDGPVAGILARLPRPAVLVPAAPRAARPTVPVVIDAWVALQELRAAARPLADDQAPDAPVLDEREVRRISLEHLLIGSAITGSPIGGWGGGVSGDPGDSSGITGPTSTDSYLQRGGDARTPVAVCLDPPRRERDSEFLPRFGRRPVVAVLDTGVRAHPWLDVRAGPGRGYDLEPDGFVAVDDGLQDAIYQQSKLALDSGDQPRQAIAGPWDTPVTADPLVGELDTDTGHGTFIAGIVRQVAPDATVLSVRIMHSDGVVYEGDLLCALAGLAARVAAAAAGDLAGMVDVVSLSLGYFSESGDAAYTSGLRQVIDVLLQLGVVVTAAAGNFSTSRRFYPAAFTRRPDPAAEVPLISVGALNPNGSKALFSDGGAWITAWASGAAILSTFPVDINAARTPEVRMRAHPANQLPPGVPLPGEREALDPDDYRAGFAIWSGTSFSAPLLAAHVAQALLAGASVSELGLDVAGEAAAASRALAALTSLGWRG